MAKKTTIKKTTTNPNKEDSLKDVLEVIKEIAKGSVNQIWVRAAKETLRRYEQQDNKDVPRQFIKEFKNAYDVNKKAMILAVGGEATKKLNALNV